MPSNWKNLRKLAVCILTVALTAAISEVGVGRLRAQAAAASIQGTVTDSSGAAIPDATVQVRNVGTGQTIIRSSDGQGRYAVPDLGIGDYELQATKTGFSTVVRKGITLTVGAQDVVDFAMQVGQQTQTVTVDAAASQVETTNASLSTLVNPKQMEELPLNGRSFESLIFLSMGVQQVNTEFGNARQGKASAPSAAGARPEGYEILMDDESVLNFFRRGMGTVTGSSLGMEAMAEFQTLTNTYGAQFGGNGAVVKISKPLMFPVVVNCADPEMLAKLSCVCVTISSICPAESVCVNVLVI